MTWWESETDIQPKHADANWATGADGKEDAVPRKYLEANADAFLENGKLPPFDD